jgi:hypothetical protein
MSNAQSVGLSSESRAVRVPAALTGFQPGEKIVLQEPSHRVTLQVLRFCSRRSGSSRAALPGWA